MPLGRDSLLTFNSLPFKYNPLSSSNTPIISWLLLLLLALMWGSSYILIKKSLIAFSPVQLACLRIGISAIAFFPLFLLRFKKVDWTKWKHLVVVGLAGSAIPAFLFSYAQTEISSSTAGLLSSLTPLFTLLLGIVVYKLPMAWSKVMGVILGLIGAACLIVFGKDSQVGGNMWYGLLVVFGTGFYAWSSNTVHVFLRDMSSLTISAVSFFFMGLPVLLALLLGTNFLEVMETSSHAWVSLGYVTILALGGTVVASVVFFKLVQMTDAVFASTVSYIIPMIALGWGVFDGETITVFHFFGMGLILSGVYISRNTNSEL